MIYVCIVTMSRGIQKHVNSPLSAFTYSDNYIDDLDETVTQEEVDRLIAYEKGDAMRVTIVMMDGSSFSKINF